MELTANKFPLGMVIPAAGASTRLGQPKQLLRWKGRTLISRTIQLGAEVGCDPVVVVLGASAELISTEVNELDCHQVINTQWQQGIGGTIALGTKKAISIAPDINGILILLTDQPAIDSLFLKKLLALFKDHPDNIIATGYETKAGVPAIFPRSCFQALQKLSGDEGARNIIASSRQMVQVLTPSSPLLDIDTPEDYRHWLDSIK